MPNAPLPDASKTAGDNSSPKSFLASKTVWGVVLLLIAPWLAKFGITSDDIAAVATPAVTLGGAVLAIYGRIKATRKLTLTNGGSN